MIWRDATYLALRYTKYRVRQGDSFKIIVPMILLLKYKNSILSCRGADEES